MSGPARVGPPRSARPATGGLLGGVLVAEAGLVVGLGILALERGALPLAGVVVALGMVAGLVRVRGELVVTWAVLALRHRAAPRTAVPDHPDGTAGLGLGALEAALGPVSVVDGRDHDGRPVALVGGEDGAWSAVLAPDHDRFSLLLGTESVVPLPALAGTLRDRGVVLDALVVLRHVRGDPGGSPAGIAHREVLGPLPDAAHRSTWLVVRLDPARCPGAVVERGGGVRGARRALVGALARIDRVLGDTGLPTRPLDRAGLRDAVAVAADLDPGSAPGGVDRRWDAVVVGEVGHASWAVSDLPGGERPELDLDALAAPGAPTTVALTLE